MEGSSFFQSGVGPEGSKKKPETDDDEEEEESSSSTPPPRKRSFFSSIIDNKENDGDSKDRSKEQEEPPGKSSREIFTQPVSEVEPAGEEEAPEGELGKGEAADITRALSEQSAEAIPEHEPEEAISQEVAGDILAKTFYEKAGKSGDMDTAANETLSQMGVDPAELADAEATGEDSTSEPAEADTAQQPEERIDGLIEPGEEVFIDHASEAGAPEESEDAADTGTPSPPSPPSGPAGTAGGGRGGVPPTVPPGPSAFFPPAGGEGFGGPRVAPVMETAAAGAAHTPSYEHLDDRANPATMALFGGIIGYLIGRRRGRIKAEKKAAKERRKLEKHVENIQWQLKAKETAIRKLAAERVARQTPVFIESLAAAATARSKGQERNSNTSSSPENDRSHLPENPVNVRQRAPEASLLHTPDKAHERIGQVLISAEAQRSGNNERAPEDRLKQKTVEELPEHLKARHIETLSRAELLAVSEKIMVDGTSLRSIYETHLIGERGLRRLVDEYLHGGDVKKILREEIVEHEIDFERDPAVRDLAVPPGGSASPAAKAGPSSSGGNGKAVLNKLVEQASADLGGQGSEAAAYYKARMAYEAKGHEAERSRRRVVDIGLALTITLLAALVIVLYLSRN